MRARAFAVLCVAAFTLACGGKPFDVKRVSPVAPDTLGAPAVAGPLAVRAEAIWDEDWSMEHLDANAPLAGVLPVRVDLENTAGSPAVLEDLELELAGAGGERFERLAAKKAMKKIESYYGISVRGKTGDKIYKEDFRANELAMDPPLGPGEHRQGLVFFEVPKGLAGPVDATLTVEIGRERARLMLAGTRRAAGER